MSLNLEFFNKEFLEIIMVDGKKNTYINIFFFLYYVETHEMILLKLWPKVDYIVGLFTFPNPFVSIIDLHLFTFLI